MTYLITGATGPIGRAIVEQLLDRGHEVRVTTRSPETAGFSRDVEVVAGDFSRGDIPDSALRGVTAAFVFPAESGIAGFLDKVAHSQIERLVLLSSLAAALEHERDHNSYSARHHLAIEEAVKATKIETTVLRPGVLATTLLFWAWSIKTTGGVSAPYGESAQAPIHEADVAAVAAAALTNPALAGQTYPMTGPQALTRRQQLAAIGEAIGRDLSFHEISPEVFSEQMAAYMPAPAITMLLDYWSDTVKVPDVVRTPVTDVTGRPGRTLAAWANDHAQDFLG